MYLQMTLDGRVSGSDVQTPYSEYLADNICRAQFSIYISFKIIHTMH